MIRKIIEFSAHNRWLVIMLVAAAMVVAVYAMKNIRLDAIPDLSDTQVIVYTQWDRSPDIIEDQVTYPIITALLGAPKVKAIRGFSDFGFSYVYVIFQDGTDIYWARSRVLEYLSKIQGNLPAGVKTGAGSGRHGRGLGLPVRPGGQERQARPGRAADLPGLVPALRAPERARAWPRWPASAASRSSTRSPSTRTGSQSYRHLRHGGGRGHPQEQQRGGRPAHRVVAARSTWSAAGATSRSTDDLGQVVVKANEQGTPVLLRDVATIALGPQIRRGVARPQRRGRRGGRHRGHAPRRERPERHRAGEGEARGPEALAARGRGDRHHLRPLRADPASPSTTSRKSC